MIISTITTPNSGDNDKFYIDKTYEYTTDEYTDYMPFDYNNHMYKDIGQTIREMSSDIVNNEEEKEEEKNMDYNTKKVKIYDIYLFIDGELVLEKYGLWMKEGNGKKSSDEESIKMAAGIYDILKTKDLMPSSNNVDIILDLRVAKDIFSSWKD